MAEYIFGTSHVTPEESRRALFNFACEVRLLLNWPLLGVVDSHGSLAGVAGVSLPGEPVWPASLQKVYDDLKSTIGPESADRLEKYSRLADTNRPAVPHFQLGLIGVLPTAQGKGFGGLMLKELHRMSENHPTSTGVWLDTESKNNVAFYQHYGYEVKAHSTLDGVGIWGMFRPNQG